MGDNPSTFGLDGESLKQLFRIGYETDPSEDNKVAPNDIKAILLNDLLSKPIDISGNSLDNMFVLDAINAIGGKPIGEMLVTGAIDISNIRKIKDSSRKWSEISSSEIEHNIANTMYYTSIASALVFHDSKITQYSYNDLKLSLSEITQEPWIPDTLKCLFRKALAICDEKIDKK